MMKKSKITTVSILLLVLCIKIIADQYKMNMAMQKELGRHYQSMHYDTYNLVTSTQQLNLEEFLNSENGVQIIKMYQDQYNSLTADYLMIENGVSRIYEILYEIAMLQSNLFNHGSWSPEEKERHNTMLRTLQLILLDFNSFEGTETYTYKLYTEEDSPLIAKIEERLEASGLEF